MIGQASLRPWPAALALLAALCIAAPAQAGRDGLVGKPGCRHAVPDGMPSAYLRWTGACRTGLAQGRGLMRAYEGGRVVQAFYGQLVDGQPALGVVAVDGGFKAGRFEGGQLVRDADRDTMIKAFDEAAAAARQAAETFRKAGNTASARFYLGKAQQLAQQMD